MLYRQPGQTRKPKTRTLAKLTSSKKRLQSGEKITMTDNNIFAFPTAPRDENSGWRLIPAKLVDARTAALLNQSELAALVGVRRQAILSYEQGVKSPEPETMAAIAKEQT